MPRELKWSDTLELGISMAERHPDVDPLSVRFTDLHRWIIELPHFHDDPEGSNEKLLEAVQMAWLDEVRDL
jgi:FeS assembly protein IscX